MRSDLMKELTEYRGIVETYLDALNLDKMSPANLYAPISYALGGGGKRLRPVILLMSTEAFGGKAADALPQAAGIEVFHNFTLLHDDVMDRSPMRHGAPTVHVKWDDNTAILSGDAMLTLATQLVAECPSELTGIIIRCFNDMAMRLYDGQRLDMNFESEEKVSVADYLTMIEGKTGALLAASAEIGTLMGGGCDKSVRAMHDFGINLGIAFQIQDDYLDLYGEEKVFGKPIGGDVLNDKKTFLLSSAQEMACDDETWQRLSAMPKDEAKIRATREFFSKLGMPSICCEAIARYSDNAISAIMEAGMDEESTKGFIDLTHRLIARDK